MNINDKRLEELKTFRIHPWPPDIHVHTLQTYLTRITVDHF